MLAASHYLRQNSKIRSYDSDKLRRHRIFLLLRYGRLTRMGLR